jgi:spore maturation protein CgeB
MNIVIVGLAITSSWGNGHATTFRALTRALASRGHDVLFLERDVPWYADNRDLPAPPYCRVRLYRDRADLMQSVADIAAADLVIVGSYVPDGIAIIDSVLAAAEGCTAFYDIDTPVTLAALRQAGASYIERRQIAAFDLYLSFTGGPTLDRLEREFGARRPRPLYCSVDTDLYFEEPDSAKAYDLGYLGTFSVDRQPTVEQLLVGPAHLWPEGSFVVAGAQYPEKLAWPSNVKRIVHLPPASHRGFYNRQRFTLNVTRRDMIEAGYSPSVRLFEAAACGTPIISDSWPGLDTFFVPDREILVAQDAQDALRFLCELPEVDRARIAAAARSVVLQSHTSVHRAVELERFVAEVTSASQIVA